MFLLKTVQDRCHLHPEIKHFNAKNQVTICAHMRYNYSTHFNTDIAKKVRKPFIYFLGKYNFNYLNQSDKN